MDHDCEPSGHVDFFTETKERSMDLEGSNKPGRFGVCSTGYLQDFAECMVLEMRERSSELGMIQIGFDTLEHRIN